MTNKFKTFYIFCLKSWVILCFTEGNGVIYGEATLKKHSGGRYTEATCSKKIQGFFCCCRNWRKRFFTVTD